MPWLFLVHQVQTPNSRERVKVWRLTLIFLRYWGIGPAEKLAIGFKDALAELGTKAGQR